jgi:hypothetical protein
VLPFVQSGFLAEGWETEYSSYDVGWDLFFANLRSYLEHFAGQPVDHERYQDLLKKAGVLNEAFVDCRTRAVLRTNAQGQQVVVTETVVSTAPPVVISEDSTPPEPRDSDPSPVVTTVDQRAKQVETAAATLKLAISRRTHAPRIMVPVLRMRPFVVRSAWPTSLRQTSSANWGGGSPRIPRVSSAGR